METLVIGDLHLKQQYVLPAVDALLACEPEIGRVVFLGDACDDWGASEASELGAMRFYAHWVAERRDQGLRVDVLLGNHDFAYVRGKRGPGSVMSLMRELRAILENGLHAQLACAVGPYLCTHAGVTNVWLRRFVPEIAAEISGKAGSAESPNGEAREQGDASTGAVARSLFANCCAMANSLAKRLNDMLADSSNWSALDSCPPSRGGWSLPGPLWADLRDLLDDAVSSVPQIVGHTPVERVTSYASNRRAVANIDRANAQAYSDGEFFALCDMTSDGVGTGCFGSIAVDGDADANVAAAGSALNAACEHGFAASDAVFAIAPLWACDTMSLMSYGAPIGDGSMLLVDESGEARAVPFPGGESYAEVCSCYWFGRP